MTQCGLAVWPTGAAASLPIKHILVESLAVLYGFPPTGQPGVRPS
jgi:hypothetical protein